MTSLIPWCIATRSLVMCVTMKMCIQCQEYDHFENYKIFLSYFPFLIIRKHFHHLELLMRPFECRVCWCIVSDIKQDSCYYYQLGFTRHFRLHPRLASRMPLIVCWLTCWKRLTVKGVVIEFDIPEQSPRISGDLISIQRKRIDV